MPAEKSALQHLLIDPVRHTCVRVPDSPKERMQWMSMSAGVTRLQAAKCCLKGCAYIQVL